MSTNVGWHDLQRWFSKTMRCVHGLKRKPQPMWPMSYVLCTIFRCQWLIWTRTKCVGSDKRIQQAAEWHISHWPSLLTSEKSWTRKYLKVKWLSRDTTDSRVAFTMLDMHNPVQQLHDETIRVQTLDSLFKLCEPWLSMALASMLMLKFVFLFLVFHADKKGQQFFLVEELYPFSLLHVSRLFKLLSSVCVYGLSAWGTHLCISGDWGSY